MRRGDRTPVADALNSRERKWRKKPIEISLGRRRYLISVNSGLTAPGTGQVSATCSLLTDTLRVYPRVSVAT